MVKTRTLPLGIENDVAALTGCVSGAASVETITALLRVAGFEGVRVDVKETSREFIRDWLPGSGVENYVGQHRGHQAGRVTGVRCFSARRDGRISSNELPSRSRALGFEGSA